MNEYFVVTVWSDSSEPWVYGRFNSEKQAEAWATHDETIARSRGDMYEYFISRLQTPTGFNLSLGKGE